MADTTSLEKLNNALPGLSFKPKNPAELAVLGLASLVGVESLNHWMKYSGSTIFAGAGGMPQKIFQGLLMESNNSMDASAMAVRGLDNVDNAKDLGSSTFWGANDSFNDALGPELANLTPAQAAKAYLHLAELNDASSPYYDPELYKQVSPHLNEEIIHLAGQVYDNLCKECGLPMEVFEAYHTVFFSGLYC